MAEPVRARRLTDQEGRRLLQIVRRGKHGSVIVTAAKTRPEKPVQPFTQWSLPTSATPACWPPSAANAPASAANASNAGAARNLKLHNRAGERS
jgi:hypothetical protein